MEMGVSVADALRQATGADVLQARALFEKTVSKYRPGFIFCANRKRQIEYIDHGLADRLGYLRSELYYKDFHTLFPENNIQLLESHGPIFESWWPDESEGSRPATYAEIPVKRNYAIELQHKDKTISEIGLRVGPIEIPVGDDPRKFEVLACAGIVFLEDFGGLKRSGNGCPMHH